MEAARTLRSIPAARVEVRGSSVEVDGLRVDDATLAELVERRLEADVAAEVTLRDALEIGARVLDREGTRAEVDMVRREFERASAQVERTFSERADRVAEGLERSLERFLGEGDGAVAKALDGHAQ